MATTDVQTALANEARRGELRQKIARLQGAMGATASAVQRLSSVNSDNAMILADSQAELAALEAGSGPGITEDYGPKSTVTRMIERERWAAKSAVIDFVKANPACSEEDAAEQWRMAALASHPDFLAVMQDALVMSQLYRANLLAAKLITEDTWEAHRQWILNNPKALIEGM
ncbi:MAG: hypothetical protein EOO80_12620 [Oxalobacteraceae bacterium]|nr:MAG: hypothetical protein EOO80_12620 [Oxalobacteraceae bacterium]